VRHDVAVRPLDRVADRDHERIWIESKLVDRHGVERGALRARAAAPEPHEKAKAHEPQPAKARVQAPAGRSLVVHAVSRHYVPSEDCTFFA
jgi:hypothetical protein